MLKCFIKIIMQGMRNPKVTMANYLRDGKEASTVSCFQTCLLFRYYIVDVNGKITLLLSMGPGKPLSDNFTCLLCNHHHRSA